MVKINDLKLEIDKYLKNYFKNKEGFNDIIYKAQDYSLNIGGKRVRPILLLLVYNSYMNEYENAMKMASAVEMIHTYSLIHDDLPCMDDDDLRRGKPTNHKIYGENIAVLAGDALLNEAMVNMFESAIEHGKDHLVAGIIISKAAGADGMIGGQIVDIISEGKVIPLEELNYMHMKKTAELIRASIVAGAVMGKAPEKDLKKLSDFGYKLGLAFQIKDDILDVIGNEEKLGKKTGADSEKDKSNFITFYGLDKCKALCNNLTLECLELINSISVDCEELKELTKLLLNRDY
ncbi:polyprenyl synthetase family protein [Clostridium sp. LY3-2]|uniref:polyprenyl synthetase family protein n=1 Tax=Clostridium sp. LY3-2 TaxID=2942482 RepID=UPI0021523F5D|nr:farnesyl diphosphate synthase [Clostridium sp. LY3-2]MCR6515858.1 polyprenyl synthetase family protein [Clostridium sp. LY3-2]